jgi:hypothetical protein
MVLPVSALPEATLLELAPHRAAFQGATIPAVVIPEMVSPATAEEIRGHLSTAGLSPFFLAHRGRYAFNDTFAAPALFQGLLTVAEHLAGAPLAIAAARWIRLVQGDYALMRDDAPPPGRTLELTLDLSTAASGGAEVCYCHKGQLFFAAPQEPRSLAVVERGPAVQRYERYLGHRAGDAEVVRLRLSLRFA